MPCIHRMDIPLFCHSLSDGHLGCFWFSAYFSKHSWILTWFHVPDTLLSALDLGVDKIKSSLYTFKRIQTIKIYIYLCLLYICSKMSRSDRYNGQMQQMWERWGWSGKIYLMCFHLSQDLKEKWGRFYKYQKHPQRNGSAGSVGVHVEDAKSPSKL